MDYREIAANNLPVGLAQSIIEEKLIDRANVADQTLNGPMYYLFELHTRYFDPTGQFDNWNCPVCKDHVLKEWRLFKPYLEKIINKHKLDVHDNA